MDAVSEILLHLPVKTLSKFKCVSKSWRSLISDPSFRREHYHRRSQQDPFHLITRNEIHEVSGNNTLLLSTYSSIGGTLINKFSTDIPYVIPIQSCRGLVCLVSMDGHIFLCNPSTTEIIALPPTNEPSHCVGLGYVDSTEEIKVVRFFSRNSLGASETQNYCEVFTLGTAEWREAGCMPFQYKQEITASFLHGALHLLQCNNDRIHCIEVFDIKTEEFSKIPLPDNLEVNPNSELIYLTVSRGSLYLTFSFETTQEFWILKDYGSGKWMKECTIDLTALKIYGLDLIIGDPLPNMGDESILLNFPTQESELLYSYNPREKTLTQKSEENGMSIFYVESLFPLGSRA